MAGGRNAILQISVNLLPALPYFGVKTDIGY